MTREETKKILMVIQAAYPNYKPQDKTVTIDVWHNMLSDITYEHVGIALKAYIQTDKTGFAPSVGEIREKINQLFSDINELNETTAWGLVWKAICNSGYHAEEEFEKLPPIIQKTVGSPSQLREWAILEDIDGNTITVLQSNFQRTFRAEQKRENDKQKLSPDIRKLLKDVLENPKIETRTPKLTVAEERMIAEKRAVPAPEGFMDEVKRRLRMKNE